MLLSRMKIIRMTLRIYTYQNDKKQNDTQQSFCHFASMAVVLDANITVVASFSLTQTLTHYAWLSQKLQSLLNLHYVILEPILLLFCYAYVNYPCRVEIFCACQNLLYSLLQKGATTLSIRTLSFKTFSIMTHRIMIVCVMTLSIMTLSIMTLSIKTFIIMTLSIKTISMMTLSIKTFSILTLNKNG